MDLDALLNSGFLNLDLIEENYDLYKKNPSAVDPSWRAFYDRMEQSKPEEVKPSKQYLPAVEIPALEPADLSHNSVLYYPRIDTINVSGDLRIFNLIEAYRTYGHLLARVNPISIGDKTEPHRLQIEAFGFTKQDLSVHFPSNGLLKEQSAPLLDIINALKATYCDKIGVEYMGLQSPAMEGWLQNQIEPNRFRIDLTMEQKRKILQLLNQSELFEVFLHTKYVGQKRFSLEGSETLIPMLASLIDIGAAQGLDEFVLGMSHRGRLNVLCNILNKSYVDIFSEFEEGYVPASIEGSSDVKYHKGFYSDSISVHGNKVKITLTPNPSHLESVGPVVEGQVRSLQTLRNEEERHGKVIPILVHGDAAIAGQGVVYETLQLARLAGYSTGGTIHFIINNQIGFTTVPKDARSTRYCTDIARAFGAPVFHVNVEDPEGCVFVTNLAFELRRRFQCDVFIELNCYRKYGHNEGDEPAFTQPLEYQQIRKKRPVRDIYRDSLIEQGVLEKDLAERLEVEFKNALQNALQEQKLTSSKGRSEEPATTMKNEEIFQSISTGVEKKILQEVGERICHVPDDFTIHPKLATLNKERLDMLKEGSEGRPLDWGMAELLAYGTLLWDGAHVRLSGQDTCRGTFSHRHAMLMDQVKEREYIPLKHLKENQGRFDLYNSPLSEYATLGFEYGYSVANPNALVIWEAQFGDFANGAQIIIDQYISTAEQKWMQKFSLTLFLPHGYEGQGPEHSSGRIERFLTLAGDNNMMITNPTTPAQFFHLLRRQVISPWQKPLIVFTPKGLLRHQACVSQLKDLTEGSFKEILDDPNPPKKTKRLVLCSGRIFYDLIAEREKTGTDELRIVRLEQLYPLDTAALKAMISKLVGLKECIWVQEEPSNMGAWHFVRPILRELLPKSIEISYVGRTRSSSPAVGSYALHKREHMTMMTALFGSKETEK